MGVINILKINKIITDKLKLIRSHQKQFRDIATDNSDLPLITYKTPNILEPYTGKNVIMLEINVFSNNIVELETLVEEVDKEFDNFAFLDNDLQLKIFRFNPFRNDLYFEKENYTKAKLNYQILSFLN